MVALTVYVDDILITGSSDHIITWVKDELHITFTIKDMGDAAYFLAIEITKCTSGMLLSQTKYILDILEDFNMLHTKPAVTPLPAGLKLSACDNSGSADHSKYRRLIGRLLYLNMSRPDLAFYCQQLSQFLRNPTVNHWKAVVHVLKYLQGTSQLKALCDSEWGTCPDSRKSITGYCVYLGECLISWKSKKQSTVSASSSEAEYRCMSTTAQELVWITYLL